MGTNGLLQAKMPAFVFTPHRLLGPTVGNSMRQGPMLSAVDASAPSGDVKHETVGQANLKRQRVSDGDLETGDLLKSAVLETATGSDQDFTNKFSLDVRSRLELIGEDFP